MHALRDLIGEENDFAIDVTRGAAGGLNERSLAAQKSFLVRIENADERNFRKIETFAEQIDADENVEVGRAQSAQDFHALDRVDVAVQITHLQSDIAQIIGQIFGRAFRQCRDENALALFFHALPAKLDRVVDLMFERFERDPWIEKSGRANDLLDHERRARCVRVEFLQRLVRAANSGALLPKLVGGRGRAFPPARQTEHARLRRFARVCAGSSLCFRRCCFGFRIRPESRSRR